jgi:hypothetical protein
MISRTTEEYDRLIRGPGKYITRTQWLAPRLQYAKDRDIKLSSDNLTKLEDLYVSWFVDQYGEELGTMQALFRAVYSESVSMLLGSTNPLLARIPLSDPYPYHVPVVLSTEHGVMSNRLLGEAPTTSPKDKK